jgi:hypothetical protein
MKILVVEDDKKIAAAVKRGLDCEGFTVDVSLDGDEGLWRATEYCYAGPQAVPRHRSAWGTCAWTPGGTTAGGARWRSR